MRKDGVNGDILIQELIDNGTIGLRKEDSSVNESLESDLLNINLNTDTIKKAVEIMNKNGMDTDYTVI